MGFAVNSLIIEKCNFSIERFETKRQHRINRITMEHDVRFNEPTMILWPFNCGESRNSLSYLGSHIFSKHTDTHPMSY